MTDYRIKPGSLRVDIPVLTVRMSAEVQSVPADPIGDLPVTNTVDWASFIHRYYRIKKSDGRIVRAGNTIESNNGLDVLPLSGVRNGDPGLEGREMRLLIEVGDEVYVHDQRVPVVAAGQIDGTEILKRWSQQFDVAEPQTQYPPPVPNFGIDRAVVVDPITGVARVTFTAAPIYWSGSGSHLWNLPPSGAVLVAGYALTDTTIEVDFDPGQFEMVLIATDTGYGLADDPFLRGFRNIYVKGTGFDPFSDVVTITAISEDRTDTLGRSLKLTVKTTAGADISDYLYMGASVLLTYQVQTLVAGVWTDLADSVTSFRGFLADFPLIERDNTGVCTYELAVESALIFFRRLGITTQMLQASSSPQNWLEVHTSLAHLAFVVFYVFEYNAPSLAQYMDIDFGIFADYAFPEFSFGANNLTSVAMSAVGRRPYGNIGCKSDGTILLRDNFCILSLADRTDLGLKHTWTAGEIRGRIRYSRNPIPRYNRLFSACFLIDGETTHEYEANLLAPGYGAEEGRQPDFLALDFAEGAWIVGNMIARECRPTLSFTYDVIGMNDVIDPAEMKPHKMDVAAYDPLDCGIWKHRWLPTVVERAWTFVREEGDIKINEPRFSIVVTGEPETLGVDAPEYTDPELGDVVTQGWCQTWDFLVAQGNWVTCSHTTSHSTWTVAQGWAGDLVGNADRNFIELTFPQAGFVTSIIIDGDPPLTGVDKRVSMGDEGTGTPTNIYDSGLGATGSSFTGTPNRSLSYVALGWEQGGTGANFANIVRVTMRGTGPSPFGADNCV